MFFFRQCKIFFPSPFLPFFHQLYLCLSLCLSTSSTRSRRPSLPTPNCFQTGLFIVSLLLYPLQPYISSAESRGLGACDDETCWLSPYFFKHMDHRVGSRQQFPQSSIVSILSHPCFLSPLVKVHPKPTTAYSKDGLQVVSTLYKISQRNQQHSKTSIFCSIFCRYVVDLFVYFFFSFFSLVCFCWSMAKQK